MQTTVFLARHGQSETNNQKQVTGQLDVSLSPAGEAQARALAACLEGEQLAAIYTSGLKRTQQTARPTSDRLGVPFEPLTGLDEIHMGVLQGRFRDERDPEAQAMWAQRHADPWNFRVPGGESFSMFAERVLATLHEVLARHPGERILIVGHRATNRVVLGTLLGWQRERWDEIRLRNKHCYRIEPDGDVPRVATYTLSGSRTGQCEPGFVM